MIDIINAISSLKRTNILTLKEGHFHGYIFTGKRWIEMYQGMPDEDRQEALEYLDHLDAEDII